MRIVNDYNDYIQLIKELPSHICTYDELQNHMIHRSEAALSLLYKFELINNTSDKNFILLLSIENQLEFYHIKYDSNEHEEQLEERCFNVSILNIPHDVVEIYNKLGKLYHEPRTSKWWKMCFSRKSGSPSAIISFDDSFGNLFVNDQEELCFKELLDTCDNALSSIPDVMSGQYDVLIMADDERLLPLELVLQRHTNISRIVLESSFNECNDNLISDFRKNYCKPSLSHKICLVSSDGRFYYLDSECTQIVYIPCNTDIASLSLTSKLSLSHFIDNQTPNIEISDIEYICCSIFSTTDVFGNTLVTLNLLDNEGKMAVLLPNGEVITKRSMQDIHNTSNSSTEVIIEESATKADNIKDQK